MDDLSGLDWSAPSQSQPPKLPVNPPSAFSSLRPSPSPFSNSGRSTPLSAQGSGSVSGAQAAKPATPKVAPDSFSNLVNFGSAKSNANLSLREQQERLELEKRRKEEEKRKQAQAAYGDGQFWDTLGQRQAGQSRTASPAVALQQGSNVVGGRQNGKVDSDDDLFAAFNAETKVDNASHYPPPSSHPASGKASPAPALNLSDPTAWNQPAAAASNGGFGDDDDPFGLNKLKPQVAPVHQASTAGDDDDDLLGDLGRPVEEVRRKAQAKKPGSEPGKPIEDSDSDSDEPESRTASSDPFDKAVTQLVDYGFTPENARRALTESGAGLNVQAAVNWLLDDAHRQAKEDAHSKRGGGQPTESKPPRASDSGAAWMPHETGPTGSDSRSPGQSEADFAKMAAAAGQTFLKQANAFWKTSQKRVQKAVAEFQQEGGDPNQPKWMRSVHQDTLEESRGSAPNATGEAMMLEARQRPSRRTEEPAHNTQRAPSSTGSSRGQSPAVPARGGTPVPRWQSSSPALSDPRARLNKQAIEEQSSQAYVSPARRRKAMPQPEAKQPPIRPEPDLLSMAGASYQPQLRLPHRPSQSPVPSKTASQAPPAKPSTPRPAPAPRPARRIPPVSPTALQISTRHRTEGTAHFKRGDFAAAHVSYSSSLAAMPQDHPLVILLLCNRALTALKRGEPRQAVADADNVLAMIGPSKGEGESVALEDGTGDKRDMGDLYGKALTRKAEALEQMEKWAEAGTVWQTCVEAGVGGLTAAAGRQRCQKALAPKPPRQPAAARKPAAASKPRPRPTAALGPQVDSDAVKRLREANKAAEVVDGEKFALSDKVDARIAAWRDGKRDNLRALLGSLDQVMWEGSGWKKVGLHEIVLANKVKISYMKAIAKCHPDKLPQDANTEVRMIAGTVFATLNESWDKFRAENGL